MGGPTIVFDSIHIIPRKESAIHFCMCFFIVICICYMPGFPLKNIGDKKIIKV